MVTHALPKYSAIPSEISSLHQWARWIGDKMPANLDGSAMVWSNRDNWLTFEEVARYPQIGYFHALESGIIGVDFDGCIDESGIIHPLVLGWIKDTYAELSPSGKGVKAYFKGTIPNGKKVQNKNVPWGDPEGHTGIEIYAQKRFFTVTGNIVPGCPSEIIEAPEIINDILVRFVETPKVREKVSLETATNGNWDLNAWVYKYLEVVEKLADGYIVTCPWAHEHTTPGDTARIWEGPPHTFFCFHAHCSGREWKDVRLRYEPTAYDKREQWTQYSPSLDHSSNGNGHRDAQHYTQDYIPSCKKHIFAAKEVPNKDILAYMHMQQLGDAQLFTRCFEGQVAYDSFEKEWYLWKGHHWQRDMHDHIRVLVSGHLGSVYLGATKPLNEERAQLDKELALLNSEEKEQAESLKRQIKEIDAQIKALIHRAKELRGRSYNTGVLYFAESLLAIPTRDDGTSVWDSLTGKIGVKNGVLDLHTGICRDGQPNDYIRTFCPTEWKGLHAPCSTFSKFLDGLFELREDKQEVIQFLIRLLGYALTGTCKEAIFAILYGPEGRNGKSTLFKIIIAILGKVLAGNIAKELLIDTGKSQHANGPKPDELDLQGKRIAIAAETKKGDKLDISAIKHYSGGDELGGRPVFGKHKVRFEPTHTLFLHTNFKPHADPGDMAFWARACLIEFNMRFVEEPDPNKPNERKYDTGLERRIIEEEASGVLACLVRGAMDYDENGLKKPQSVQLANEAYRVSEDTLQTFINECCSVGDGLSVPSSAFIKAYQEWSGDDFKLTSKELKKQMEKKGFKVAHTKKGNIYERITFVGEGRGSGEGKSDLVKDGEGSENTFHTASEADLDDSGEGSEGSLCKVPHEEENKSELTKLSQSAFTAFTDVKTNGLETASEATLQHGEGKKSAFTTENLPSPRVDGNNAIETHLLSETPLSVFWQIGKRHSYPEIPDLDLKSGIMGWNSFSLSHRLRIPDVIARLGGAQ